MFEVSGKYGTAKIFTDVVDNGAISQVIELLNQPYAEDAHVRMMPDIHVGAGCTIGTTMRIKDKICPNLVGVDISCGMYTAQIEEKEIDFELLDKTIRQHIPAGFSVHAEEFPTEGVINLEELHCASKVDLVRARKSIGTLGGGNHFWEVDKDDDGNLYLVVHSGSRHLGKEVAEYYQNAAWDALNLGVSQEEIQAKIDELKRQGRQAEIQDTIKAMKSSSASTFIPKPLAYVEGELFTQYIHDMKIMSKFAWLNRLTMMLTVVNHMGLHVVDSFTTVHNYIDTDNMILRKGSVSAQAGERLLIPINMRDGSLLCVGKGNPDWNFSAPHGAGRLMSRQVAKETLSLSEFREQMQGIFTTSVNQSTLDECPMAYKGMEDIVDNIEPTADILKILKPVYNFKAG